MKKETILLIIITLAIGVLAGVIFTNAKKDSASIATPQNQSVASAPSVNYQQKITALEGIVASDPTNRNAWVQLGHNYFDANQPMKAITAYDKALEMNPNDSNVLTDQGVMYRRVGWFDKAIGNFTKANELNPNHLQSLYNLGIVYRDDLRDVAAAKQAWTKYLAIAPPGQGADQVRTMIQHMETGHQ